MYVCSGCVHVLMYFKKIQLFCFILLVEDEVSCSSDEEDSADNIMGRVCNPLHRSLLLLCDRFH